jgi:sulfopyruvate decarboxylase subunit alpha
MSHDELLRQNADAFLRLLEEAGYGFHAGVPCSLLKTLIQRFDDEPRWGYVSAVREDSAVGLAAGAWMGGRLPVVYMQNSGLGVAVNALQSLSQMYSLPVLVVVTWRGEGGPAGIPPGSPGKTGFVDAPEHIAMGMRMTALLEACDLPYRILDRARMREDVREVTALVTAARRPAALVVRKGIFGE